ncbi:MAG: hypothetical protein Q9164_002582 [Protoblastenia rupestris]
MSASKELHKHTFRETKVYRAKCDYCQEHNDSVIYRCQECRQQKCKSCYHSKGRLITNIEDRPSHIAPRVQKKGTAQKVAKPRARRGAKYAYVTVTPEEGDDESRNLLDYNKKGLKEDKKSDRRTDSHRPPKREQSVSNISDEEYDARILASNPHNRQKKKIKTRGKDAPEMEEAPKEKEKPKGAETVNVGSL